MIFCLAVNRIGRVVAVRLMRLLCYTKFLFAWLYQCVLTSKVRIDPVTIAFISLVVIDYSSRGAMGLGS